MNDYRIIVGDCAAVLPNLPRPRMIFADPPDNLGMTYAGGYDDARPSRQYLVLLRSWFGACIERSDVAWFSFYHRWLGRMIDAANALVVEDWRLILWRFTFGQHRHADMGNGFRPILRVAPSGFPWNTDAIRVPSRRQELGDKRADPRGRVPDDVWEFPRVCGTYRERRPWHPTQHPEALVERAVLMSTRPGDLVIDPFAGTGTTLRVCQKLGRRCIVIEQSREYAQRIAQETGAELADNA